MRPLILSKAFGQAIPFNFDDPYRSAGSLGLGLCVGILVQLSAGESILVVHKLDKDIKMPGNPMSPQYNVKCGIFGLCQNKEDIAMHLRSEDGVL